jgi:hypothetical protein
MTRLKPARARQDAGDTIAPADFGWFRYQAG